ncbi:MAG: hypothetical protein MZV63_11415 [Marinilabiliales bacterium]|nr:hypothetical protein [Marinilabiliales bacterium]
MGLTALAKPVVTARETDNTAVPVQSVAQKTSQQPAQSPAQFPVQLSFRHPRHGAGFRPASNGSSG